VFKTLFIILFMISTSYSTNNIFTITSKNGKVFKHKRLKSNHNTFFTQKTTDYSFQAIYDQLHKEENLARAASQAKSNVERISKAKARAKRAGKVYHLSPAEKQQLLESAKYYKGGKYVWGGTTPQGFDCSGYVQYLYKQHHINLPRTAYAQSQKGVEISRQNLKKGDLLFFLTDKSRGIPVTHVGIYLGNDRFIHAASKRQGIIISPLSYGHYAQKFVSAKRVL